jgi:hypothetical protein
MDSWILKQLRALVLTDLKDLVPQGYFESEAENLKVYSSFKGSEYLSIELQWGILATELGKKLHFQTPVGLTARQVSASDLLMNLGMLAASEAMSSKSEQLSNKALAHNIPDGNSGNVASQLKNSHIPTFQNNISGALEQYLKHLTYEESKPYISLLPELKQSEIKLMNENNSKITNNTINVSGNVIGNIHAGESNVLKEVENSTKFSLYKWLVSNIGKLIFGLLLAALTTWFGLK